MKLVAVVGPTGVGKSSLALSLAREFNGEIVNADSRQVYRYMDIGTAKPTAENRAEVPHHLLDVVNPDQEFNQAIHRQLADTAIADITARGKLPLLVGGSGLYVWAVLEGWEAPPVPPDQAFRGSLALKAEREGDEALFAMLEAADPVAARHIDRRNRRRVIRALEVCQSGEQFSRLRRKSAPAYDVLIIGLTMERNRLYWTIDRRVERMVEAGLIDEVRRLREMGYGTELPAMSGIGYRQFSNYLDGQVNREQAVSETKAESRRFARRQFAWFKVTDARIKWFEADSMPLDSANEELTRHLSLN